MNFGFRTLILLFCVTGGTTIAAPISGTDANRNGVRDDVEETLMQAASSWMKRPSATDFGQLIDVVKLIQPEDVPRAIDMHKFYCGYRGLPASIKDKVSARMIITVVTDTPERKKALARQVINTTGSLGAEVCE